VTALQLNDLVEQLASCTSYVSGLKIYSSCAS